MNPFMTFIIGLGFLFTFISPWIIQVLALIDAIENPKISRRAFWIPILVISLLFPITGIFYGMLASANRSLRVFSFIMFGFFLLFTISISYKWIQSGQEIKKISLETLDEQISKIATIDTRDLPAAKKSEFEGDLKILRQELSELQLIYVGRILYDNMLANLSKSYLRDNILTHEEFNQWTTYFQNRDHLLDFFKSLSEESEKADLSPK